MEGRRGKVYILFLFGGKKTEKTLGKKFCYEGEEGHSANMARKQSSLKKRERTNDFSGKIMCWESRGRRY